MANSYAVYHSANIPARPALANHTLTTHAEPAEYDDGTIEYKFNSLGYRTREITDYLDDNFIMGLGCSFTEGVGLCESDTWLAKMAKMLSLDHINLAVCGSGIDLALAITTRYLSQNFPLPRLVVVQHSERNRRRQCELTAEGISSKASQPPNDFRDHLAQTCRHMQVDITDMYYTAQTSDAITMLWNQVNVPVLHWTFGTDGENYLAAHQVHEYPATMCPDVELHTDLARDQSHNGPCQHQAVAKYMTARYCSLGTDLSEPQRWSRQLAGPEKILQDRIKQATLGEEDDTEH